MGADLTRVLFAVILWAMAAVACGSAPDAGVERFDVRLALQSDGSLVGQDSLRVRVVDDVFRLRRTLDRHDAVVDVVASTNGVAAAEGNQPGQVQVRRGGGLDVEWRLPGPGTYDLDVRYRATGAVAVRGGHAALSWPVLPANRHFRVTAARVELMLPPGTQLSEDPYFEEGGGWNVTRDENVVRADARDISSDRQATLVVPFFVDPRAIDEPRWQADAGRARDLLPAFISGALFILVIAGGALVMIRVQYPRGRTGPPDPARATVARGLRVAGIVTMLFGLAALPVTEWTLGRYGVWPHAMPISVIIGGIALLLFGARRQI